MKGRPWWILAGAVALLLAGAAAAALHFLFREREAEWTTRSKAALAEFERGTDAAEKGYRDEALRRFDRALDLDPKFVAAKIYLSAMYDRGSVEFKELITEIEEADLEGLNARERFLVRYWLADSGGRREEAERVLDEFLAEYPEDYLGLEIRCERAWMAQDWEKAEACYNRMIELHPNRVEAYERLGYIDMAQGRFTEAEEHFKTYGFIAPDQSVPYTSLAQLLVLLGRYDEAEATLFKAIEIEEDDCWIHYQLLRNYYFAGRFNDADALIDRMADLRACEDFEKRGFFCHMRGLVDFFRGDFEKSWAWYDEACLESQGGYDLIGHHAALAVGLPEEAEKMQQRVQQRIEMLEGRSGAGADLDWFESLDSHFEGVQQLAAGNYAAATANLTRADERVKYWTHMRAGFKLLNRAFLARSLELEGKTSRARALLDQVEAVNPSFADHLPELRFLKTGAAGHR